MAVHRYLTAYIEKYTSSTIVGNAFCTKGGNGLVGCFFLDKQLWIC